jgi:fructose-bisphosphate aldolase class I
MDKQELNTTVQAMMQAGKGLLAMDESNPTCNKRFARLGIPQTVEARRAWRELILTTDGLGEFISGAILYDETIRQSKNDGTSFVRLLAEAGIVPGIKVDTGAKDMAGHPGEKVTEGLDGLRERLVEYRQKGARFAKWRAVIAIGGGIPSRGCLEANAHALARYAALCQEAGLVPIVEPEVLMDGDHTLEQCALVTEATLHAVFSQLYRQGVLLDGVAFLSGGQSAELASARLNAMNLRWRSKIPWVLTFSFSRAIQQPALDTWKGKEVNTGAAQKALYHRARCNGMARRGEYSPTMEKS